MNSCWHPFGCQAPGDGCHGPCPVTPDEGRRIEREVTAAPGPQQPDEVPVWCLECGWQIGPYGSCDCYEPRPNRPAAPSAQPDRSLSQQRRLAVQDPAQPDEVRCTRCDEHVVCTPDGIWVHLDAEGLINPAMHAAAPPAQPERLHAPGPGSSLTGYLPQCWCQEKDDVWPCPSAQPDRVTGQGAAR